MKRVLAVTMGIILCMAAAFAQLQKKEEATQPRAESKDYARNIKFGPKVSAASPQPNVFPIFTDTTGDLGPSVLTQVVTPTTTYLGFGTTNPLFNLHFVSTVDPAALTIEGYGTLVGINFMGRRARGTPASPQALQKDDNIMAMQGRGYGATAFSPYSRAYMKFFAAENWSDTAQGSYITMATTLKGTSPAASATERLRITDAGWVGLGTTTAGVPIDQMLTVAGSVHVTSGGIVFPDGTTLSSATSAPSNPALSSSDNSITINGNSLSVNKAVIQARVTGSCAAGSAVTGVNADGSVACGTIGPNGTVAQIPVVVANTTISGSYGAGNSQTIYTPATSGFYRVTVYMNVPTTGPPCSSSPCAGEAMTIQWSDGVSTTSLATSHCDLTAPCAASYTAPIWVQSGQAITAYGQSWGTGTAPTGGAYNAYILVEQL